MFSDALSLLVALIAFIYAEKHATVSKTYGYKRFEVLAALFNGVTLFVISILIVIEAIKRFFTPPSSIKRNVCHQYLRFNCQCCHCTFNV